MSRQNHPSRRILALTLLVLLVGLAQGISGCGDRPGAARPGAGQPRPPTEPAATAIAVPLAPTTPPGQTTASTAGAVQPTVSPQPSAAPTPTPVVLSGGAGTSSSLVAMDVAMYRTHITSAGAISVTVRSADRVQHLLQVDEEYDGSVPGYGVPSGSCDVVAGGAWTVEFVKIGRQESAAFAGKGDAVSDMFQAPAAGPWRIVHQGDGPFAVQLHCVAADLTVFESAGSVDVSQPVPFPKGYCVWIVEASGAWSLAPEG